MRKTIFFWYNIIFFSIFGRLEHFTILNKINNNSKINIAKNRKNNFSFASAHCASSIKLDYFWGGRRRMRGGGGGGGWSAYPYLVQGQIILLKKYKKVLGIFFFLNHTKIMKSWNHEIILLHLESWNLCNKIFIKNEITWITWNRLNHFSQLVIGYHKLAFLNQVRKNMSSPNSLIILSSKSTISQKIKIGKLILYTTLRIFLNYK